jgi:arylsulfatase
MLTAETLRAKQEAPPMQAGASFNVGDLKEKVQQAIAASKAANQ